MLTEYVRQRVSDMHGDAQHKMSFGGGDGHAAPSASSQHPEHIEEVVVHKVAKKVPTVGGEVRPSKAPSKPHS